MATVEEAIKRDQSVGPSVPLNVVLSGSYRRDREGLGEAYTELLERGCRVLSPLGVDFVAEKAGFLFGAAELDQSPETIEARHLARIEEANFVWLHCPDGYVGLSAALEVGFAHAVGVPIYSASSPGDVALAGFTSLVRSIAEAVAASQNGAAPIVGSLRALQHYYARTARARGYDRESPQDCMLLLTEEVGELARSIRQVIGLTRNHEYVGEDASEELADVQLYLVHLANILAVDLERAVESKERRNLERSPHQRQV
jgi:NTP pyrophosphatase (non-canonical NTP hydrolase)